MSQSRQALALSILYSLPLLIWLLTQLQSIQWNTAILHALLQQSFSALILLQVFATTLLFVNRAADKWQYDVLAVSHMVLFPLPLVTLIGLTGSVSLSIIGKSYILIIAYAAIAILIQRCKNLFPARIYIIPAGLSLMHILLAILAWNFRYHWWSWLNL